MKQKEPFMTAPQILFANTCDMVKLHCKIDNTLLEVIATAEGLEKKVRLYRMGDLILVLDPIAGNAAYEDDDIEDIVEKHFDPVRYSLTYNLPAAEDFGNGKWRTLHTEHRSKIFTEAFLTYIANHAENGCYSVTWYNEWQDREYLLDIYLAEVLGKRYCTVCIGQEGYQTFTVLDFSSTQYRLSALQEVIDTQDYDVPDTVKTSATLAREVRDATTKTKHMDKRSFISYLTDNYKWEGCELSLVLKIIHEAERMEDLESQRAFLKRLLCDTIAVPANVVDQVSL